MEVEIDGFETLLKALQDCSRQALPLAEEAMEKSVAAVVGTVAEYPPETAANRPGRYAGNKPLGYYDRGVGWWYPVRSLPGGRLTKTSGRIRAPKGAIGYVGYKLSKKRSERLRLRWATRVSKTESGVEGVIGNSASYVQIVHGLYDQAGIHAGRGWKRIDRAFEDASDDIDAAWTEALEKLADQFNRGENA